MDAVSHYLQFPWSYCPAFGRLRWSYTAEVIEHEDAGTFAFAPEIALFLEGFTSVRPLVHFSFVLHLLHLLGYGRVAPPLEALELRKAFRETGRPIRNAGALCALLCRDIPPAAHRVNVTEVCQRLSCTSLLPVLYLGQAEECDATLEIPPLGPAAFEDRIFAVLRAFQPDELKHRLRHGCGHVQDAGEPIVRELEARKPRTPGEVMAALAQRPRLAGAVPFVAHLVSALALPPRRLANEELPIGGYADVATRGEPERILPSQFALDTLEFVRRFAENELLYFRREEPHIRTREELVLLLDQGVRTWGVVRLVLAAAAFAFGRLAARKRLGLHLAGTSSSGGPMDPLQADEQSVADLVERSDFSANPGLALERLLEERAKSARDVVLLTHPRNLAEPDVAAAARRVPPGTRLFAVTVDAHGSVQLSQVKHGIPVKLCRFQVDVSKATGTHGARTVTRATTGETSIPWQGDVEPVGFPFPLGVTGPVRGGQFDFDESGEWLLVVDKNGLPHAYKTDGSYAEILPRTLVTGRLLTRSDAVLGVANGFVVTGRIEDRLAVVHYDLSSRECFVHSEAPMPNEDWKWFYFRQWHSVVARGEGRSWAVDLSTGERLVDVSNRQSSRRAAQACVEAQDYFVAPPWIHVAHADRRRPPRGAVISLDEATGTLSLDSVDPAWKPFTPQADGLPVLKGCRLVAAQCRGNILAATFFRSGRPHQLTLRLFEGPQGIPLSESRCSSPSANFALSSDGRWLARQTEDRLILRIDDLAKGGAPVFSTPRGRHHDRLLVHLGKSFLTIQIGKSTHLLRWDQGPLLLRHSRGRELVPERAFRLSITQATKGGIPDFFSVYHRQRFVMSAQGDIVVAVDAFGQLTVFDRSAQLVCMFYILRGQVAAWMPDGTRYGPPGLCSGPATPHALEKLGQALRAACERGREERT